MEVPRNSQATPEKIPEFNDANNFSKNQLNTKVNRFDVYTHSEVKPQDTEKYIIEGHLEAFIDKLAAFTVSNSSSSNNNYSSDTRESETDSDTQSSDPESGDSLYWNAPPPPVRGPVSAPPPPIRGP
eukprot:2622266-Rhodomonas_salina.1